LLEVMVHEIAHHFELEDEHGDRWQTCCAALAHCFGLTLRECSGSPGERANAG
jgi:hypothetical protein